MRRFSSTIAAAFLFAVLIIGTERPALAYTDPGSGALLLQTLGAVFVGFLFYFRRITAWLRGRKGPKA